MGSIRQFSRPDTLGPDDIRAAVTAFEAALESLGAIEEPTTREALARSIMHHALLGERDPIQLRDEALADLAAPNSKIE